MAAIPAAGDDWQDSPMQRPWNWGQDAQQVIGLYNTVARRYGISVLALQCLVEIKREHDRHRLGDARTWSERIDPVTTGDIVRRLNIDPKRVSERTKVLARKGLIARAISPEDERRRIITLTDKGRTAVALVDQLFAGATFIH